VTPTSGGGLTTHTAVSGTSTFRSNSEAALELEVAKRREREARAAIDKMDKAGCILYTISACL
jgi:hypothetical protein